MKSRCLLPLFAALALAGCANLPAPPAPTALFADGLFRAPTQPVNGDQALALSPAMQQYLDHEIAQQVRREGGGRQGLISALYSREQLKLEYDATLTRNAAEAFEARRGNCMALVLMTAAFAKAMHMPVRFNSVYIDDIWSRSGNLIYVSGHVNLSLGWRIREGSQQGFTTDMDMLTIDFVPPEMLRGQRSRVITEDTLVAMYMNNRAAEQLEQGLLDDAYWWARAAMVRDPHLLAAHNTLGVIYRRHHQPELAERVFRAVLAQEPANVQTLSNLILVLQDRRADDEVRLLSARLAELQPDPPFRYFDEGMRAMRAGDFRAAKRLFTKEIERSAYFHEFHFWLALANYGLGDLAEARKHMALARDNSPTLKDREMYAAKLDRLRAVSRLQ